VAQAGAALAHDGDGDDVDADAVERRVRGEVEEGGAAELGLPGPVHGERGDGVPASEVAARADAHEDGLAAVVRHDWQVVAPVLPVGVYSQEPVDNFRIRFSTDSA